MSHVAMVREYARLRAEGERLAGGLADLSQRAAVYFHIYQHSGGNHIFPLIAAHGALWARAYFQRRLGLARLLVWQYFYSADVRVRKLQALDQMANSFRDINRRVCIDTYTNYFFAARYGTHPQAAEFIRPSILKVLNEVHAARQQGVALTDADKREVFLANFLDEQDRIVGPTIRQAVSGFDWPVVKLLALRPVVDFKFLPPDGRLKFTDFSATEQRIANGLAAFDAAARVGWRHVEQTLRDYHLMPAQFFADPLRYFRQIQKAVATS